jgi:hypothetical protein
MEMNMNAQPGTLEWFQAELAAAQAVDLHSLSRRELELFVFVAGSNARTLREALWNQWARNEANQLAADFRALRETAQRLYETADV